MTTVPVTSRQTDSEPFVTYGCHDSEITKINKEIFFSFPSAVNELHDMSCDI